MDAMSFDCPFSSDIRKKIKRNFFKSDVAVKSYKCDFIGPDINTQAKVYISTNAAHVVHRPKRRKLTTIPFSGVTNIQVCSDGKSLDFYIFNGPVYTLTRFERADSAIAFILNFWNMVRKEKLMNKATNLCLSSQRGTSSSTERFSASPATDTCSSFSNSLTLLKAPTTISLNSSASISESESVDSRKLPLSSKLSTSSRFSEPPGRLSSHSIGLSTSDLSGQKAKVDRNLAVSQMQALRAPSISGSCRSTPSQPPPTPAYSSSSPPSPTREISECVAARRLPLALRTTPSSPSHLSASMEAKQRLGSHPILRPALGKQKAVCLTDSSGWMVWPFSFLPYPFSTPPQRLTMAIAYVLLAFLLFSTMHLYHRLAVFDFNGGSRILTANMVSPSPHRTSSPAPSPSTAELHNSLRSLRTDLSKLVGLTEQLTRSLMQLTAELQSLPFFGSQPSSDHTATVNPSTTLS